MSEQIERKSDRRRGASAYFTSPQLDQRRPAYERRVSAAMPLAPGAVRPGVGEAVPPRERRRYLDGGME